jgi:hypothetical protein
MSEGTSISIFGELSKPATVLIERISNAVGTLWAPRQIRRIAQAEADAAMIQAKGEIEITELTRRAIHRWVHEETRCQANIESITTKALPHLRDDAQPDQIEDDWLTAFFNKARFISDDEMQALWAGVLAGEANQPGIYSKRTIDALSVLEKRDADQFQTLCRFNFQLPHLVPMVFDIYDPIYSSNGLCSDVITHLDSIGLITFAVLGFRQPELQGKVKVNYFRETVAVESNAPGLESGHVIFTEVGLQLCRLIDAQPIEGFLDYVLGHWRKAGNSA